MGVMKELESTSTLFGANAPFIEELYERYLADPAGGVGGVARVLRRAARRRAGRGARARGRVVPRAGPQPQGAPTRWSTRRRCTSRCSSCSSSASSARSGMFRADLDPLKHTGRPYIPGLDLATYGFTEADMDTEFDVGSFKAGPPRMPARHRRRAAGHVLPHVRRRVHVHRRHADEALPAGAARARARAAELRRRATQAAPRAADGRRDARALPAHEVRRPEALFRRRRRDDDPDARPPDPGGGCGRRAGDR